MYRSTLYSNQTIFYVLLFLEEFFLTYRKYPHCDVIYVNNIRIQLYTAISKKVGAGFVACCNLTLGLIGTLSIEDGMDDDDGRETITLNSITSCWNV